MDSGKAMGFYRLGNGIEKCEGDKVDKQEPSSAIATASTRPALTLLGQAVESSGRSGSMLYLGKGHLYRRPQSQVSSECKEHGM